MTPKLRAVRKKITAGAEQLKGIEGNPLVAVLANPRNSWVPLEGPVFIGALYGDSQVSFAPDGELFLHSGRNGRLQPSVPDRGGCPSVHLPAGCVGGCNEAKRGSWQR